MLSTNVFPLHRKLYCDDISTPKSRMFKVVWAQAGEVGAIAFGYSTR